MIDARDWKEIAGDDYDWRVTAKPERPYIHDYTKTMTMKMFLAEPDGRGGSRVFIDIDKAADIIRRVDRMTMGAPKILYLVGWQYNGHDDRYPAWHEGNPAIKRAEDRTPIESIRWLMEEGSRHHTTVSVHINMYDAYENSPLWNTYVEKGLLNTTTDGKPDKAGVWNGLQAYSINYGREWETGFAKKRIDEILELLPLERAGTVHIDAFHCRPDMGRGQGYEDSQAARRKIFRYWRDRGIDVTSEFLYDEPVFGYEKPGPDQLIGLQPMAWHFSQKLSDYIDRPAGLICGGSAGHRGKPGGEKLGALFGENIVGEPLWADWKNRTFRSGWEGHFLEDFCLKYLPFRFLNGLHRLSAACTPGEITAKLSKNVTTMLNGPVILQGGEKLREGNDVLLPADWISKKTLITYSKDGGTRTWTLPRPLKGASSASVQDLTTEGPGKETIRRVSGSRMTFPYLPGQAYIVTARD